MRRLRLLLFLEAARRQRDVFDEVTRRDRGRRATRIAAFVAGAAVVQAIVIAAVLLRVNVTRPPGAPAVEVIFPRRGGLAAEMGAPGAARAAILESSPSEPARAPRTRRVAAHVIPAPDRPPPLAARDAAPSPAVDRGASEGALADPAPAGGSGGAVASAGGSPGVGDDAPRDPGAGFSTPIEMRPGCVRSAIRIPRDLAGFVSGPISVKFAVGRDGAAALVQVVTPVPDPRIADAIRAAVTGCAWRPGADAQGRPVRLWVVLPVRFTSG